MTAMLGSPMAALAAFYARINAADFSYQNACYQTCDSYCCRNFPAITGNFRLLRSTRVQLYFFPGEWQSLTHEAQRQFTNVREMAVALPDCHRLKLTSAQCALAGACGSRPLLCKLYPYLPDVDCRGKFKGMQLLTAYDRLTDLFPGAPPCTLLQERDRTARCLQQWLTSFELPPVVLFCMHTLGHYLTMLVDGYRRSAPVTGNCAAAAATFEELLLTGKLLDQDQWRRQLDDSYYTFARQYGAEFLEQLDGSAI